MYHEPSSVVRESVVRPQVTESETKGGKIEGTKDWSKDRRRARRKCRSRSRNKGHKGEVGKYQAVRVGWLIE
jgi:hypothetical protein